jgi:hypothetical protein
MSSAPPSSLQGVVTATLVRLGAILTFLGSGDPIRLYWHQVLAGWTALRVLASAVLAGSLPPTAEDPVAVVRA